MKVTWSRYPELLKPGYEVSTKGDKRFSALTATLKGSRQPIEKIYQLDVKGYRRQCPDWRMAKGKPPLNGKDRATLFDEYLNLWRMWAVQNPELIHQLRALAAAAGNHLTDQFATTPINQAHALSIILNETAR